MNPIEQAISKMKERGRIWMKLSDAATDSIYEAYHGAHAAGIKEGIDIVIEEFAGMAMVDVHDDTLEQIGKKAEINCNWCHLTCTMSDCPNDDRLACGKTGKQILDFATRPEWCPAFVTEVE